MATVEERLTALEKDTQFAVQDINHQLTVLTGVMSSQGQDIKKIFLKLDSLDGKVSSLDGKVSLLDGRLTTVEQDVSEMKGILGKHTAMLDNHAKVLNDHTTRLDRMEGMLGQILERLPEKQ